MKNLKQKEGITLIALVITIIVLLILAGVTINMLTGENGIITKAKEAKQAQELAEIKERLALDIVEAQMGATSRNESLEQSQLEDIISNYGELQEDKNTIILKDEKGIITLADVYNGTTATTGSYTENKAKIELLESQIKTLQEQLEDASQGETETYEELRELKDLLAQTTVTEDTILKGYTAYKDGQLITGNLEQKDGIEILETGTASTTVGINATGRLTINLKNNYTSADNAYMFISFDSYTSIDIHPYSSYSCGQLVGSSRIFTYDGTGNVEQLSLSYVVLRMD